MHWHRCAWLRIVNKTVELKEDKIKNKKKKQNKTKLTSRLLESNRKLFLEKIFKKTDVFKFSRFFGKGATTLSICKNHFYH